jgi:hypothetical protein
MWIGFVLYSFVFLLCFYLLTWLYEPNPPKTLYILKKPKTRVVSKNGLHPRKRLFPKIPYTLKTAHFTTRRFIYSTLKNKKSVDETYPHPHHLNLILSNIPYQGGANRGIQNRPKTGTPQKGLKTPIP